MTRLTGRLMRAGSVAERAIISAGIPTSVSEAPTKSGPVSKSWTTPAWMSPRKPGL